MRGGGHEDIGSNRMNKKIKVLAINPGSTSTKIALFEDYEELFSKSVYHSPDELKEFKEISDQCAFRADMVEKALAENGFSLKDVDVFSGRGGGMTSVVGGVYKVSDLLSEHASKSGVRHPAQLAPQIAKRYADKYGKPAFVVNSPDTDEFCDVARVTGVKGIYRESHIHALNQKEIALRFCAARGLKYENINLIICHLGGGISVTAHKKGRMIDSNDIIKGSGPMTPTRAGDLPYTNVIELAYSGEYSRKELIDKLNKDGGLTDHFGTTDVRAVLEMIECGDKYAETVLHGMFYQVSKYVGSMAAALKGDVDAIILTGGISNSEYLTGIIKEYTDWIAEVAVMPGEFELEALAAGAVRVMRGEEEAKEYTGIPVWNGF